MICKRFPEGIPEEIWDNLKNFKYKPCDKFEFEPLNNKYNWVRGVGFGIFYLILFAYCVTTDDADSAITSSLTLLLCAVVVYEMCLHELKVERNHWLSSWRYCRMLLENEKEKIVERLGDGKHALDRKTWRAGSVFRTPPFFRPDLVNEKLVRLERLCRNTWRC